MEPRLTVCVFTGTGIVTEKVAGPSHLTGTGRGSEGTPVLHHVTGGRFSIMASAAGSGDILSPSTSQFSFSICS